MKELLEEYIMEKMQLQQQMGILTGIISVLMEGSEEREISLDLVSQAAPVPIGIENGIVTIGVNNVHSIESN